MRKERLRAWNWPSAHEPTRRVPCRNNCSLQWDQSARVPRMLSRILLWASLVWIPVVPQSDRPVRFPPFPNVSCDRQMAYCNRTIEAGLRTVKRYGRGAAFVDVNSDGWDDLF